MSADLESQFPTELHKPMNETINTIIDYEICGNKSLSSVLVQQFQNYYQPPGAAQRSIKHRDDCKKPNFLFNWINLKAERERYPNERV